MKLLKKRKIEAVIVTVYKVDIRQSRIMNTSCLTWKSLETIYGIEASALVFAYLKKKKKTFSAIIFVETFSCRMLGMTEFVIVNSALNILWHVFTFRLSCSLPRSLFSHLDDLALVDLWVDVFSHLRN